MDDLYPEVTFKEALRQYVWEENYPSSRSLYRGMKFSLRINNPAYKEPEYLVMIDDGKSVEEITLYSPKTREKDQQSKMLMEKNNIILSETFCDSIKEIRLQDYDENTFICTSEEESFQKIIQLLKKIKGKKCKDPEQEGMITTQLISEEGIYEFTMSTRYVNFDGVWFKLEEEFTDINTLVELIKNNH